MWVPTTDGKFECSVGTRLCAGLVAVTNVVVYRLRCVMLPGRIRPFRRLLSGVSTRVQQSRGAEVTLNVRPLLDFRTSLWLPA